MADLNHAYRMLAPADPGDDRLRLENTDEMPAAEGLVFKHVVTGELFRTRSAPEDSWNDVYRAIGVGDPVQMFEGDKLVLVGWLPGFAPA